MRNRAKRLLSLGLALALTTLTPGVTAAEDTANADRILGDVNGDGLVDIDDALHLFQHSILPDLYTVDYPGTLDHTGDGYVDIDDALYLFQYSMLPELYPIEWGEAGVTDKFIMFEPKDVFDAEEMSLTFNSTRLCASARDAKGEGNDVSYSAWMATYNQRLNDCYGIYYNLAAHKLLMSVAFYDEDGEYISGVGTDAMTGYATSVTGFVVCPENAAKVRFLGFNGTSVIPAFNHSTVMLFDSEESFNAAKAMYEFDGLKIACLGDSLTEGDYGPLTSYGGRRFENYPYYLSRLTGAEVTNYGRCGASSSSYLAEHFAKGDVDVSDSDVILLMLGTNKGLASGSGYYADYCTIVDRILAEKKPGAKLILITPPSATTDPTKINYGYMDNVLSANEAVRAIAASRGLDCIDALKKSPIKPQTEHLYQDFDGLHMNADGYAAFARFIAIELDKILSE
ncbi:MAG: hypothetical protein E7638_07500 [Ruminococcaceae bacterium]|nr:hypothetical protein [Oscillospiraceae bacterium]